MPQTVNPSSWLTLKLFGPNSDPAQQQLFLQQLVQFLTNQASISANSFNNINNQIASAQPLNVLATDLGLLTSAPTVNCAGAGRVFIGCSMGAANRLITVTNLALNSDFILYILSMGLHTVTLAASDPSANAYTVFVYYGFGTAAAKANMTTTGWNNTVTGLDAIFIGKTLMASGTRYLALHGMGG